MKLIWISFASMNVELIIIKMEKDRKTEKNELPLKEFNKVGSPTVSNFIEFYKTKFFFV